VTALDGTLTYTLTEAQLSDVWFYPPPNESGTFAGMTIVATSVEPNGSTQSATAPIQVVVTPVADVVEIISVNQTTNEDTPVRFGDDITINILDPLNEHLTQVVVTGFPVGTIVTYDDVLGVPRIVTITTPTQAITLTGGTETQIRDALATLTLTPPLHTDGNITLTIAATTTDTGTVSRTDTAPMTITVLAVADAPTVAVTTSGTEDQPIPFPVLIGRPDADGTETFEYAAITPPAGVSLVYGPLPNGIIVTVVAIFSWPNNDAICVCAVSRHRPHVDAGDARQHRFQCLCYNWYYRKRAQRDG
jgi:large repetitive protein